MRLDRFALGDDTRAMVRLTAFAGLVTAALIAIKGLEFPPGDVIEPAVTCAVLLLLAAFYQAVRPAPNFVLALKALCMLVAFSTIFSVLMYAVATCGRPLADGMLARADGMLGLGAPAVVQWVNERPMAALAMRLAYFSLIPQTILAIVYLGLTNDRDHLDKFLVRFMIASLITVAGFHFFPAKGTYGSAYNLAVPNYCQGCAAHLDALRSGGRLLVTWRDAEGLITFPSFHTIWAVLLIAAFAGCRRLFGPLAVLNVVVVMSTITTGMHYFVDVFAGLAVAAIVIWATKDRSQKDPA